MALSLTKLRNELLKVIDPNDAHFVGFPTNATDFANNWANAYDTYARDAQDVSTDPVVTTYKSAMAGKLQTLNVPAGLIATAAQAFDDALKAYWMGPAGTTGAIFATLVVPTPAAACASVGGNGTWAAEASSIVSSFTAGILQASMLTLLAIPSNDPQVKATALANALHTATTSAVKVTITGTDTTPPPSGPQAITNTCTIS